MWQEEMPGRNVRMSLRLRQIQLETQGLGLFFRGLQHAVDLYRGELSEWFKEHAWKACGLHGLQGSNPWLSAIFCNIPIDSQLEPADIHL